MPASCPLPSAQLRQVALTGQLRQISLAVLTWDQADLWSLSGKKSSGSASRQAASSRQSGQRSLGTATTPVDMLTVLCLIVRPPLDAVHCTGRRFYRRQR
jgi:hypothetical protein